jgi:large conductance mechanosensitive channel
MRNFVKELKEFISSGNMLELAVAVILGAAIAASIKAFTEGIVMQLVAAIFGKPDFNDVKIVLRHDVGTTTLADGTVKQVDATLQIGTFINTLITLVITGLILFLMIKAYNRFRRKPPPEGPTEPTEVELLTEIRDALRTRTDIGRLG